MQNKIFFAKKMSVKEEDKFAVKEEEVSESAEVLEVDCSICSFGNLTDSGLDVVVGSCDRCVNEAYSRGLGAVVRRCSPTFLLCRCYCDSNLEVWLYKMSHNTSYL